jgi:KDO2-lipid IV(A) lauroyltransferase
MLFQLLYPLYKMRHPHAEALVERNLRLAGFASIGAATIHKNLLQNALSSLRFLKDLSNPPSSKNLLKTDKKINPKIKFEHPEILLNELEQGRPVVAASIHLGAFEILHRSLTAFGKPVHLLASELQYPLANRVLHKLRSAPNIVLHKPAEAAAALKETIQNQEILALMLDQSKDPKGTEVTLFGEKTKLFLRLPLAANRMGASVVAFHTRPEGNQQVIHFSQAFAPKTPPQELQDGLVRLVEEWIAETPEHFAWNYERLFA